MTPAAIWTTQSLFEATSGKCNSQVECFGVSIDTRTIEQGDLFIALIGPNANGHDYLNQAFEKGCAAAIVSKIPENCAYPDQLIIVEDTTKALNDLGYYARNRSTAKIVGVTGSVGKTGVKEAIAHVLSNQGQTHATVGNLNNHFGLPLTLARMPLETEYAVLEMGMNHAGEIDELTAMGQPDVAVITTIAAAHLENFENIQGICDAKCEIFRGVTGSGSAIINADNEFYERMHNAAKTEGIQNIMCFGAQDKADFKVLNADPLPTGGARIQAEIQNRLITFSIPYDGGHWVTNSLCVLAACKGAGIDVVDAAQSLSDLKPLKGRGAVYDISLPNGIAQVIDESYNANEASMRAAMDVLAEKDGRKVAVLGDMLELGPDEIQIHQRLADALIPVDQVYCCGPLMEHLFNVLPTEKQAAYRELAKDLAPVVCADIQPGDVVSVKSSRGTRTDLVVDALLNLNSNES